MAFSVEFGEKLGVILSQLNCAICLDTFSNPVSLSCGNTFCKNCITLYRDTILRSRYQNTEEQPAKFSCPSCRVDIGPRAAMPENVPLQQLADLARRAVRKWEVLFGRPYCAPKVSVPLTQSTASSVTSSDNEARSPLQNSYFRNSSIPPSVAKVVAAQVVQHNESDPYRFKSTQSQDKENEYLAKKVACIDKSSSAVSNLSNVPSTSPIAALSSINSDILKMRAIVQAAEDRHAFVTESEYLQSSSSHKDPTSFSNQKRTLSCSDPGNSGKRIKLDADDTTKNDRSMKSDGIEHFPRGLIASKPASGCATFTNEFQKTFDNNLPNLAKIYPPPEVRDVAVGTPEVSGYIIFFPDGKTAMASVIKYLADASVQTEDFACAIASSTEKKTSVERADAEVQTRSCISGIEIQNESVPIDVDLPSDDAMDIVRPQLDEVSSELVYRPVEQLHVGDAESEDLKKQSQRSIPSAASLCPDSLAACAALCISDQRATMEETMVADTCFNDYSKNNSQIVLKSPEVIPPSPKEPSQPVSQEKIFDVVPSSVVSFLRSQDPCMTNNLQLSVIDRENVEVNVNANLRPSVIHEASEVDENEAVVCQPVEETTPSTTKDALNLTEITPATEFAEKKTVLGNIMARLCDPPGQCSSTNQSSTPSGAALRKFTFTTMDPIIAVPKNVQPLPAPLILPLSQPELPQILRDARSEPRTISITCSNLGNYEPYVNALKAFCDLFQCRQTSAFLPKATTHVIIKTVPVTKSEHRVCDRTLKYLQAVAARRWVVSIQWVLDSVREKRILPEETYEITGDTSTSPDTFGPTKMRTSRSGLFDNLEVCCSPEWINNTAFTCNDIFALVEMCGGIKITSPDAFSYKRGTRRVIAMEDPIDDSGNIMTLTADQVKRRRDMHRRFKAVIMSLDWILDSISRGERIDATKPEFASWVLTPVSTSEIVALVANNP